MSVKSRLDKLYKTCPRIRLAPDAWILFVSDTHMNNGGPADDFKPLAHAFYQMLVQYWPTTCIIMTLGDIWELWECPDRKKIISTYPEIFDLLQKYDVAGRLLQVKGNHDNALKLPEALVLQVKDLEIFCIHGYQGDFFNDKGWWIGQNVVRYLWLPLQWIGIHDPAQSKITKHIFQWKALKDWAWNNPTTTVSGCGHVHELIDGPGIFNSGSWVNGKQGEAWEFKDGQFRQRTF